MSTMKCSIVSAEQEIFAGDVQMLSVTGAEGELGITPGHSQLLTSIKPGPVKLTLEDGTEEVFFASGGFVEVQPHEVTLLSEIEERADDIDESKAERAKELALRNQENAESDMDFSRAKAELAEASARLQALRKLRKK